MKRTNIEIIKSIIVERTNLSLQEYVQAREEGLFTTEEQERIETDLRFLYPNLASLVL